ncbi:MAG: hypothetical protein M3209_20770 [Acidobacteriota bacterium]|nr:hypothetical protein [Acidobacteriota bacterium]
MNNAPRQALREIIAKYGTEICSDSRRCEGLLKDKCGSFRREISILINALEERVPLDLLAGGNSLPRELLLNRLAKRLEDNLALTENAAVWAVETWALALNLITEREIAERENGRAKNQAKDSNYEKRIPENDIQNLPPKPAPHKQPPPKTNQPPPFAPPPNPSPRINIPNQTQPVQVPTHPAPKVQTLPQTKQTQTPAPQIFPARRSRKLRGCFIGCFLLLILLGILAVGVPYTYRVMREAQESVPPPRVPQQ